MAATFSDHVVLLRLAGVARVNWDMRLLDLVFGLPLLDASIWVRHDALPILWAYKIENACGCGTAPRQQTPQSDNKKTQQLRNRSTSGHDSHG